MTALLLDAGDLPAQSLVRGSLTAGHDEKWLQALLYAHPELIPIERIDPGAAVFIPLCRELPIPKVGTTVFLDLLGVTAQGKVVLVECKLWRNPEARREVVAQVLEYAALLRRWSYADLTARLKMKMGWSGANPLYEQVKDHLAHADEAGFVDAVSRSLKAGDFDLVIAGDGIREDLSAIAEHLGDRGAQLALVEFQLWTDANGRTLVVPTLPLRTEVVRQHLVVDPAGIPLQIEEEPEAAEQVERVVNPEATAAREKNHAFWQRFIDSARFDHPDQPPPRHGGPNWVKIPMPAPARWLTAYRTTDKAGLFLTLLGEDGAARFEELAAAKEVLEEEIGFELAFKREQENPFKGTISLVRPLADLADEDAQRAWFIESANRVVNASRPRLGE